MANAVIDTGHGATMTFGTSSLSYNWTSIDMGETTLPDVDTVHLGTTGNRTYLPGDLTDDGEVTIPFQFDAEAALPTLGSVETVTVTFPQEAGQTAPATYAGTAYIKRVRKPNLQTDTLQDGEITIRWDGQTGPTFTAATTA